MLGLFFLAISLSIDTLVLSFAYGASHIKIPILQQLVTTTISSFLFLIAIVVGNIFHPFLSQSTATLLCSLTLIFLGSWRLLKCILTRKSSSQEMISPMSLKESVYLGFALSLDSLTVGLTIGLLSINFFTLIFLFTAVNLLMFMIGNRYGLKLSKRFNVDLDWLSGLILILLALVKFS